MTRYRTIAAALILLAAAGLSSEGRAQCVSQGEGQHMVSQGQVHAVSRGATASWDFSERNSLGSPSFASR